MVSKYIQIKQKSLTGAIYESLKLLHHKYTSKNGPTSVHLAWHRFIQQNMLYTHLQDELGDYNRFLGSYLSFVFINYVLLISCFIYIVFLSSTALYFKAIYLWVGFVHIVLLSSIIHYSGAIVQRNGQLSIVLVSFLAHFTNSNRRISYCYLLKVCGGT